MNLVTRSEWGARPPKKTYPIPGPVRGLAVHYTAGSAPATHSVCHTIVRAVQNYHMDIRNWYDIAYSFLVCNHGYVFEGRGWGIETAAQGTTVGNDEFHAACWLGKPGIIPTQEAYDAMQEIWSIAPGDQLRPHSSFKSTGCPGDLWRTWIQTNPSKETAMALSPEEEQFVKTLFAQVQAGSPAWAQQYVDRFNKIWGSPPAPGWPPYWYQIAFVYSKIMDAMPELPELPEFPELPELPELPNFDDFLKRGDGVNLT